MFLSLYCWSDHCFVSLLFVFFFGSVSVRLDLVVAYAFHPFVYAFWMFFVCVFFSSPLCRTVVTTVYTKSEREQHTAAAAATTVAAIAAVATKQWLITWLSSAHRRSKYCWFVHIVAASTDVCYSIRAHVYAHAHNNNNIKIGRPNILSQPAHTCTSNMVGILCCIPITLHDTHYTHAHNVWGAHLFGDFIFFLCLDEIVYHSVAGQVARTIQMNAASELLHVHITSDFLIWTLLAFRLRQNGILSWRSHPQIRQNKIDQMIRAIWPTPHEPTAVAATTAKGIFVCNMHRISADNAVACSVLYTSACEHAHTQTWHTIVSLERNNNMVAIYLFLFRSFSTNCLMCNVHIVYMCVCTIHHCHRSVALERMSRQRKLCTLHAKELWRRQKAIGTRSELKRMKCTFIAPGREWMRKYMRPTVC